MSISVSLEKMETVWIAYVEDYFGCFASHTNRDEAIARVPGALRIYLDWCAAHCMPVDPAPDLREPVEIKEIVQEWVHPETGEMVNAFFVSDVTPLNNEEVDFIDCLLEWTRGDLLDSFVDLPKDVLATKVVGDWSIGGILYHTARADWWYLSTLGLAPAWTDAPDGLGLAALIDWTQSLWLTALPGLVEDPRIEQVNGEFWTPRKLVRRALWHRKDHVGHIWEFRKRLGK